MTTRDDFEAHISSYRTLHDTKDGLLGYTLAVARELFAEVERLQSDSDMLRLNLACARRESVRNREDWEAAVAEVERLAAREQDLMADLNYARAYLAWQDSENPSKISTETPAPQPDEDLHEA